ncbi:hypothetical protein [Alteromonas hispanica]|uniref:Uncharacterized protein n=1 Tax=Alteromonas hispanica TaxID=315421 RepID=A0A6L9MUE7_9ALTE|nr:hypothetical protein [Alteromonas hispanica]NDW21884.1 hypothetical protein [Alteromonas hispanica]
MKAGYWIVIIIVTSAIAFTVGRSIESNIGHITGQEVTPDTNEGVNVKSTSNNQKSSSNKAMTSYVDNNIADNSPSKSSESSPRSMEDIVVEVGELLTKIEENPREATSILRLVAFLERLTIEELLALAPLFENSSESQRSQLIRYITAQIIEKDPGQALAFAQRFNPMPDFPMYLPLIKAQVAEKRPDLGFEYLNQMLNLAPEDIDLNAHSALLNVLAKEDLTLLIDTLAQFKEKGADLENSFNLMGYELETSEEYLNLFNELRRLDDMSILHSVMINWAKTSPTDVLERLNQIEDNAERKELSRTVFYSWMRNSPEIAADYFLAEAANKVEILKDIMRAWPEDRASDALVWISSQSNIDANRYKIDYLQGLSYLKPNFVLANLTSINLDKDEEVAFHRNLYNSFKRKSSKDAAQFLNTTPFKDEILGIATEQENSDENRVAKINQVFNKYFDFKYKKAFALALGANGTYAYSYVVNKPSQNEANQLALSRCEKYRYRYNVDNACEIYAEGDVKMFNLMP